MVSVPDADVNIITAVTGSGSSCCYAAAAAMADAAASAKQIFGNSPSWNEGEFFYLSHLFSGFYFLRFVLIHFFNPFSSLRAIWPSILARLAFFINLIYCVSIYDQSCFHSTALLSPFWLPAADQPLKRYFVLHFILCRLPAA